MKTFKQTITLLFFLTLTLITPTTFAAQPDQAKFQQAADDYLAAHRVEEHISAVALTVRSPDSQNPVSVYAGTTTYDGALQVTENNLFTIGSITKSFITTIILQLESDPKNHFTIDDPIDKFFPEYPNWRAVTIRQLMNMTSGIDDYPNDFNLVLDFFKDPTKEWQPAKILSYIYDHPLRYTPGTGWNYSNTNYFLLGMLIEKITGHTVESEINERLIKPLHLQHTYYLPHAFDDAIKARMTHGYIYIKRYAAIIPPGTDTTNYNASIYGAAGAIFSNSDDVAQWSHDLLTPGKVLTPEQFKKLTSLVSMKTGKPITKVTADDPRGFGLGIIQMYFPQINNTVYAYQGMTLSGRALYVYSLEENILVAMTINSSVDVDDNHIFDLFDHVYALLKPQQQMKRLQPLMAYPSL